MKILAIDTTEQACSAALLLDDDISESYQVAARQHSQLILPMVEGLLGEAGVSLAELDGLAFARGPGSFTGVRIAAAVTQGLAVAADLPVVPVSSLLALAQGVMIESDQSRVLAVFDARMGELYWAPCEAQGDRMQFAAPERVSQVADVSLPTGFGGWVLAGSGVSPYGDQLEASLGLSAPARYPEANVHARDVARLARGDFERGAGLPAEQALPVYLRDQVAQKMRQRPS